MSGAARKVQRSIQKKTRKALQGQMPSMAKTMADLPKLLQRAIETNEKLVQANAELMADNERVRKEVKLMGEEAERTLEEHENRLNKIEKVPEVFIGLNKLEKP